MDGSVIRIPAPCCKLDDPIAGQTINEGKYYPANFDKPHIVNVISNYRFSSSLQYIS